MATKSIHVRLDPDLTAPVVKLAKENSRSIPKEVSRILREFFKALKPSN